MSNQPPQNPYNQPPQGPPSGGGYGAAPQMSGGGFAPAPNVTQPKAIALAVKLMYAGAVVTVIGGIGYLLGKDTFREQAQEAAEQSNTAMSSSDLDSYASLMSIGGLIFSLIFALLWVAMARTNAAGKSWARIVATVLGAFGILGIVGSLIQSMGVIIMLVNIITGVLAIVILVLLWKKESTAYYQARSMPR